MARLERWLIASLLAALVVWGVALRLQDPLSTRALAAEDPYTHVVFTKEWLDQGYFADSFHLGTQMYPPGMHAFVGAFAAISGVSLYSFARIAPALLGGLAILGMYALASRVANPAAGLGAAFLTAIIPEHIFRSELLFPTAFDLALLPLWLLAFHMLLDGERLAGGLLFAGAGIPLALMHPWAVPLLGGPLGIYAALRVTRAHAPFRASLRALQLPFALLTLLTAFAMAFRWDKSDTGFVDFLAHAPGLGGIASWGLSGPIAFALLLPMLAALAAVGAGLVALFAAWKPHRLLRAGASLAAGALLLALVVPLTGALPRNVSYHEMLGPIALVLALGGFALTFARPSALGDLGVSLAVVLFPLTALDVFGSPFWPERTVAYLTVGVALLGANLAGQAYEAPLRLARTPGARRAAGPAALVALGLVAAGAATAMPVDTYSWYRLYEDDEFRGFERVVSVLDEHEGAKVFVATWQPGLLVKALGEPQDVWYSPKFFQDAGVRSQQLDDVQGPAYVLVDSFTRKLARNGDAELGFLDDGGRYALLFDEGARLYEVKG